MATVLFVCLHNAGRSQMSRPRVDLSAVRRRRLSRALLETL
jgi:protein-tyrosine-phosphatase